jgi:uncharacterized protein (TIGR02996 family)
MDIMAASRPEVLAFLNDIKAHADDDTPRLILADWLDEHGEDRGEFVRIQCRLAAADWGDPHADTLAERQRELLLRHAAAWTAPLAPYILDRHFRRGLFRVNMTAGWLVELGESVEATDEAWAWIERP